MIVMVEVVAVVMVIVSMVTQRRKEVKVCSCIRTCVL